MEMVPCIHRPGRNIPGHPPATIGPPPTTICPWRKREFTRGCLIWRAGRFRCGAPVFAQIGMASRRNHRRRCRASADLRDGATPRLSWLDRLVREEDANRTGRLPVPGPVRLLGVGEDDHACCSGRYRSRHTSCALDFGSLRRAREPLVLVGSMIDDEFGNDFKPASCFDDEAAETFMVPKSGLIAP